MPTARHRYGPRPRARLLPPPPPLPRRVPRRRLGPRPGRALGRADTPIDVFDSPFPGDAPMASATKHKLRAATMEMIKFSGVLRDGEPVNL